MEERRLGRILMHLRPLRLNEEQLSAGSTASVHAIRACHGRSGAVDTAKSAGNEQASASNWQQKRTLESSMDVKKDASYLPGCLGPPRQTSKGSAYGYNYAIVKHPSSAGNGEALTSAEKDMPLAASKSVVQPDASLVAWNLCMPSTARAGGEGSGAMSLSRNNAMTRQARFTVMDCIFCRIIQGRAPAFKIYEDEMCICILDVQPLSHGHSLIIPKAHFPSLELTPPEVAAAMCATVPHISMAIMEATNCDSFNLLVNSGEAAGQVVFHTHFHIIPRRHDDNLWRSEGAVRRQLPSGHENIACAANLSKAI